MSDPLSALEQSISPATVDTRRRVITNIKELRERTDTQNRIRLLQDITELDADPVFIKLKEHCHQRRYARVNFYSFPLSRIRNRSITEKEYAALQNDTWNYRAWCDTSF